MLNFQQGYDQSHLSDFDCITDLVIKDKTAQIHEHDAVYYVRCPDSMQSCNQDYLGETDCSIIGRTSDHNGNTNIHICLNIC